MSNDEQLPVDIDELVETMDEIARRGIQRALVDSPEYLLYASVIGACKTWRDAKAEIEDDDSLDETLPVKAKVRAISPAELIAELEKGP